MSGTDSLTDATGGTILVSGNGHVDATVARQTDRGLRIVTTDDCTVADLSALQRFWTEAQYLALTNHSHRLIEFTDGCIEVLPMPTQRHQAISRFLFLALVAAVRDRGGDVFYAPLRLRIRDGKFREPDIMLVRKVGDARCRDEFWTGADLVVEVVSPDDPYRDLVEKRIDYAEAGIPEYWIVNPIDDTVDRARPWRRRIPGARRVSARRARRFAKPARRLDFRKRHVCSGTAASMNNKYEQQVR